jgi:hypothetical protein
MVEEEIRLYASHHQFYVQDSDPRGTADDPSFWLMRDASQPVEVRGGAQNGALLAASARLQIAPDCTETGEETNGDLAVTPRRSRTICTDPHEVAPDPLKEPPTSFGRASLSMSRQTVRVSATFKINEAEQAVAADGGGRYWLITDRRSARPPPLLNLIESELPEEKVDERFGWKVGRHGKPAREYVALLKQMIAENEAHKRKPAKLDNEVARRARGAMNSRKPMCRSRHRAGSGCHLCQTQDLTSPRRSPSVRAEPVSAPNSQGPDVER